MNDTYGTDPYSNLLNIPASNDWINPVYGIITSSFGDRINPVLDKDELHNGIDIAVVTGTEVLAVRNATITEVTTTPTYGNTVRYITDTGHEIMYAHLDQALVQVGQKVAQGQVVALSGNSGLTTGAHLHYSIWQNGTLIDPISYVSLPYTSEVEDEYVARGAAIPQQIVTMSNVPN